jgi:hypothetical protein
MRVFSNSLLSAEGWSPRLCQVKTASKRFTSLLQRAFTYISRAFQRSADGVGEMIVELPNALSIPKFGNEIAVHLCLIFKTL